MPTDEDYPYYQDPNAPRDEESEFDADDAADDELDPLGPGEHDAHLLDDDHDDEILCPACGEPTYADAPQCANCGHWISEQDLTESSVGGRIATGVVVLILILAIAIFLGRVL